MKGEVEELQLLLRSRFPILVVETAEEQRFLDLIENVANLEEQALFTWSVVQPHPPHARLRGLARDPRSGPAAHERELPPPHHRPGRSAQDGQGRVRDLLRKGRFDEIFFVDLPLPPVRAEIFRIHLARRSHAVERFDLEALAAASERFSGAEIEQSIVAATYAGHAEKSPLETRHILEELRSTRPLAVVRAEKVAGLREWARDRTVPTD